MCSTNSTCHSINRFLANSQGDTSSQYGLFRQTIANTTDMYLTTITDGKTHHGQEHQSTYSVRAEGNCELNTFVYNGSSYKSDMN